MSHYETQNIWNKSYQGSDEDIRAILAAIDRFDPLQDSIAQWAVVFLTGIATIISIVALLYLRLTLLESRRIGQREVRAYIGISAAKLTGQGKNGRNINVQFRNSGNSPAYKGSLKILAEPNWDSGDFNLEDARSLSMPVLGPGQEYTHTKSFGIDALLGIATACLSDDVNFHLYGVFSYEDAFEEHRETHFRMLIEDPTKDDDFLFCRDGNDAT